MFGTNPLRKPENDPALGFDGSKLRVQSIFKTIQGEGPYAGTPAIFLRLSACNLKCYRCDTQFETGYENLLPTMKISQRIFELAGKVVTLVVITGGEPLLQNITTLCKSLTHLGRLRIQIETAGTVWVKGLEYWIEEGYVSIVCSPKTGKVHPKILQYCQDWKYLICEGEVSSLDGLPNSSTQVPGLHVRLARPPRTTDTVWLQPCEVYDVEKATAPPALDKGQEVADQTITSSVRNESASKQNIDLSVQLAMKYGYRLSLQLHKILGLP